MTDSLLELGLVDDDEIVLDEAALELAALDHVGTDLEPYLAVLDEIEARLRKTGGTALVPAAQADRLAQVIAGEFGFAGDRETYDDAANADLIRVIDRRRGLPVSLSILYVAAARRLDWPAHALDVPGHVLVLIGETVSPVVIDPFRNGTVVGASDLAGLVATAGDAVPAVRQVTAMPNRAVLVRLLQNQASRAEAAGRARRALTLYERMTTFAPDHGHAWWERARLELIDGRVEDARTSLSAILEVTREPAFRARVSETLEAIG